MPIDENQVKDDQTTGAGSNLGSPPNAAQESQLKKNQGTESKSSANKDSSSSRSSICFSSFLISLSRASLTFLICSSISFVYVTIVLLPSKDYGVTVSVTRVEQCFV